MQRSGSFPSRFLHARRWLPLLASVALAAWAVLAPDPIPPRPSPLRVAVNDWVGYVPFFLARESGRLDTAVVQLKPLSSTTATAAAMHSAAVDAVALTLDEAIVTLDEHPDSRVVAVLDESLGGDFILAREGIATVAELKGRRVALRLGTTSEYLLQRALETSGMGIRDIQLVPVAEEDLVAAWKDGRADAVVAFEPLSAALAQPHGTVIFDSSRIPGEILDVLVVRGEVLVGRVEDLRHLLRGWFDEINTYRRQGGMAPGTLARYGGLSLAEAAACLRGLRFPEEWEVRALLNEPAPGLRERACQIERWLVDRGRMEGSGGCRSSAWFGPEVDLLYGNLR